VSTEWTAVALITGLVALAALALCFIALRRFQQMLRQQRLELQEQVEMLDDTVRMLAARLSETPVSLVGQAVASEDEASIAADGESDESIQGESIDAAIAPEIQAAIAAAAVAAAGPGAQVRSARLVKAREDASAWSQQGRVLVQSSHNVHGRR
jgi:hypothetical protein